MGLQVNMAALSALSMILTDDLNLFVPRSGGRHVNISIKGGGIMFIILDAFGGQCFLLRSLQVMQAVRCD